MLVAQRPRCQEQDLPHLPNARLGHPEALSGVVDLLQGEYSLFLAEGRGDSPKLGHEQQTIQWTTGTREKGPTCG